jgi:hypothetical protein
MIGASIYGFVDYERTKHKKEFTNMYKETEVKEPVTDVNKENVKLAGEKTVAKKKEITATEDNNASAEKKEAKVVKKKRKMKREFFGRGKLD